MKFLICLDRRALGCSIEADSQEDACKKLQLPVRRDRGQFYGFLDIGADFERIYFLEFPEIDNGPSGFSKISSSEELSRFIS